MNSESIAVIIPCYNEALTIGKVIDDFHRELPQATVYVYDNNSSDDTSRIATEHGATVRFEPRQGKGNVCRQMFRDIDADCYLMVQIETELSIHAVDHRWRIKDVPIEYRDRPEGSESKLNTVSDGIKVVAMIGTLFKDYRPLKFFSLVALLFAVFGLALGMPIVVEYFQTGLVPRFPTAVLAASFMFLCGLSLATGFILDSVAKVEKKQWEVNVYSKYAYDDQPGHPTSMPSER